MALDITKQNEFLESIDCEKNENGQFIYESDNGASRISLAYILIEYDQWRESQKLSTSESALPISDVGGALPTDEEIEKEAEARYPVKTHSKPEYSPYVGSKKTFIHVCNYVRFLVERQ